jgi:flagellin-like hook-associated protein FlgL
LAASGNGIELVTADVSVTAPFQVIRTNSSFAASELGLVSGINDTSDPPVIGGGSETITGRDVNPREVNSVFNALIRLRDALDSGNELEIERAVELVGDARSALNQVRGEIGARQQGLDFMKSRLETEEIQLRETLSLEIDTDLVAAISNFTARQASFEASLRTAGQILQISLLNFL